MWCRSGDVRRGRKCRVLTMLTLSPRDFMVPAVSSHRFCVHAVRASCFSVRKVKR